jgi:Transglycosylase SLT domain
MDELTTPLLPPKGGRWIAPTFLARDGWGGEEERSRAPRSPPVSRKKERDPPSPLRGGGRCLVLLSLLLFSQNAQAATDRSTLATKICAAAETEATANNIDPSFFARLLWRESLFDPNVVSDKGAQGIAQFMPETAKRRGLEDPFDPVSAVKASASFLSDLRNQFGNLGLAAAAYNAGEQRVIRWQAGTSSLPLETQDYVAFITGKSAEDWKEKDASFTVPAIGKQSDFASNCVALALRKGVLSGTHLRSAPRQPWGALLAAGFNEGRTVSLFQRLKLRFPQIIAKRDPMVLRKRNLSRGRKMMVFVMLGEKTAAAAQTMCGKLEAAGAPCIVRKN